MANTPKPGDEQELPGLPSLFVTRINARTFCYKAGVVIGMLALAHVFYALTYCTDSKPDWLRYRYIGLLDLDQEESFGTYYSSLMLLFIARILWHHGRSVQKAGDSTCWWWLVLAVGFHWLSLDEIVAMHEILNSHLKDQAPLAQADRWTTYGFGVACVVGVVFLPFLWRLRWRTAIWFAVGGALYLLGTLGIEKWTDWYENADMINSLEYNIWTMVEETIEMIGPVIFLHALLAHISGSTRGTVTHVGEVDPT